MGHRVRSVVHVCTEAGVWLQGDCVFDAGDHGDQRGGVGASYVYGGDVADVEPGVYDVDCDGRDSVVDLLFELVGDVVARVDPVYIADGGVPGRGAGVLVGRIDGGVQCGGVIGYLSARNVFRGGAFPYDTGGVGVVGRICGDLFLVPEDVRADVDERLGIVHLVLSFLIIMFMFNAMMYMGAHGMPRRVADLNKYPYLDGVKPLNVGITHSLILFGVVQLLFIFNFFWSLFKGKPAGANPWDAATLEWTVASPPVHGNFGEHLPVVTRGPHEYGAPESGTVDYVMQNA